MTTDGDRLRTHLKRLGLHTIADVFEREAQKAAKTKQSYLGFLSHLIDDQLAAKADRSVNARLARARFPAIRTLEQFQFDFQPSIPAALIRELAELGFLSRAENILFLGPRTLHAHVVGAIERTAGERLEEHTERLAHHALRGELWDKAFGYLREAGARAMAHLAPREAKPLLEQALEVLQHLPETDTTIDQAIETRLALRAALFILNEHGRVRQLLAEATALAEKRGDHRRLGGIFSNAAISHVVEGDHQAALDAAQRAHIVGEDTKDSRLLASACEHLGLAHYHLGNYESGVQELRAALAFVRDVPLHGRLTRASHPWVQPRVFLAWCLAERGNFAEARAVAEEAVSIAKTADHEFARIHAQAALGHVHFWQGALRDALGNLELAFRSVESANAPLPRVASGGREAWLGLVYAELGRIDDALPVLNRALDRNSAWTEAQEVRVLLCAAQGYLAAGHGDTARDLAVRALTSARQRGERGHEALAQWLLGELTDRLDPDDADAAEARYDDALTLAEPRGMRPLVAHCRVGLAKFYRRTDKPIESDEHFSAAASMYHEMGMTYWLAKAEAEMAGSVEEILKLLESPSRDTSGRCLPFCLPISASTGDPGRTAGSKKLRKPKADALPRPEPISGLLFLAV